MRHILLHREVPVPHMDAHVPHREALLLSREARVPLREAFVHFRGTCAFLGGTCVHKWGTFLFHREALVPHNEALVPHMMKFMPIREVIEVHWKNWYFCVHLTSIVPHKLFFESPSDGQMATLYDTLVWWYGSTWPDDIAMQSYLHSVPRIRLRKK